MGTLLYIPAREIVERNPLIYRISLSTPLTTVSVPHQESSDYGFNYVVDWGDRSPSQSVNSYNDGNSTHIYAESGEYEISILGICESFVPTADPTIIDVLAWGDVGLKLLGFMYCPYLNSIPEGPITGASQVTSCAYMFYGCLSLGYIEPHMFDLMPNVTSFMATFPSEFAYVWITSIPEGLFDNNPLAENFYYTFGGTHIVSIPEHLFDNCPLARDFSQCFVSTHITSIPVEIFKYNTLAENFNTTFGGCLSLPSIPEDLFIYNTNVKTFEGTFSGCTLLTTAPVGLFRNCPLVTSFYEIFFYCNHLSIIPEDIFKYNVNVTIFALAFEGDTALIDIPEKLFKNNTLVTDMGDTFANCSLVASIPSELFLYNTLVESFTQCFYYCTGILSIPDSLFDSNLLVTTFSECFSHCTGLTGSSIHLWTRIPVPSGGNCYTSDIGLSDYAIIPNLWKGVF